MGPLNTKQMSERILTHQLPTDSIEAARQLVCWAAGEPIARVFTAMRKEVMRFLVQLFRSLISDAYVMAAMVVRVILEDFCSKNLVRLQLD